MMPTCVVFDVDDILFEFYEALALFHNERYDSRLTKEDFFSYMVHEVWGGTPEDAKQKVREFYQTDGFRYLPLVHGAPEAVRLLKKRHELIAVTGRPQYLSPLTEEMINRHFGGCFRAIHHTDAFGVGGGIPRPKVELCTEVGARVIIEDYHGHAVPCAEAGMHVILLDQPWNRVPVVCEGVITRVHSLAEILKILL